MREEQTLHMVTDYVKAHIGLSSADRILVGLSGGADSVALLDILLRLGYDCIACHCNFRLRGAEAERDRDFAGETARQQGVPFYETAFDTQAYAARHKLSVEMACRELRYRWFEELRCRLGADWIAVAHHRDDSVETMLLNLVRGTGIAGLCGIRPVNGRVIRPLLPLTRSDIETYLASRSLSYMTDSTNRETRYTRNKIRLQLLPLLQSLNPAVYDTLERTMQHLGEVNRVYADAIARQQAETVFEDGNIRHIRIEALLRQPAPKALLFEMVRQYGFGPAQVDDIWAAVCSGEPGKRFLSGEYTLVRDRDELLVAPAAGGRYKEVYWIEEDTPALEAPLPMTFSRFPRSGNGTLPHEKNIASLDAGKLRFPLTLRRWKKGDRFVPFGMKGSRKVSDYFSDRKYSLLDKENAWLLCSGDDIVWLVGERISEKFKITADTVFIYQIICEK